MSRPTKSSNLQIFWNYRALNYHIRSRNERSRGVGLAAMSVSLSWRKSCYQKAGEKLSSKNCRLQVLEIFLYEHLMLLHIRSLPLLYSFVIADEAAERILAQSRTGPSRAEVEGYMNTEIYCKKKTQSDSTSPVLVGSYLSQPCLIPASSSSPPHPQSPKQEPRPTISLPYRPTHVINLAVRCHKQALPFTQSDTTAA
ncbi:hypothetical protein D9758_012339 [Tetrapyrgos nigripes]|uniref:Uncharacterized protein n=1 Tax=Tetrapyrgos nigripes TaxID=182062 RepID=A0A8H5CM24_9AGAR|nr:hypothetical protein D9758_012339 [Tetrapyrgos nigripes]